MYRAGINQADKTKCEDAAVFLNLYPGIFLLDKTTATAAICKIIELLCTALVQSAEHSPTIE